MRKNYIILLLISTILFACNKSEYQFANIEDELIRVYSQGLFTPLAKFDSTGYGFAADKDSNYFLIRISKYGQFKTIAKVNQLFGIDWCLDSLNRLNVYSNTDGKLITFYQYKDSKQWRLILIDTSGNITLTFRDTFKIDTFAYNNFLCANTSGNQINLLFAAAKDSAQTYFVLQKYDLQGNYDTLKLIPWLYKSIGTAAFNVNGDFGFFARDDSTNSTYIGLLNIQTDSLIYTKYDSKLSFVWHTKFDNDKTILVVKNLETNEYIYSGLDLKNKKIYWTYTPSQIPVVPLSGFIQNNNSIILGALIHGPFKFGYPNIPVNSNSNLALLKFDQNGNYTKNKIYFQERLVPVDYLKISDTTYSSISYGRTFNYFPATFVIKFSSSLKIF